MERRLEDLGGHPADLDDLPAEDQVITPRADNCLNEALLNISLDRDLATAAFDRALAPEARKVTKPSPLNGDSRFAPSDRAAAPSAAEAPETPSEDQLRSLVANIPGAVYRRTCVEPWTMNFISDHIEELTGYPASDFMNESVRSLSSIICAEDQEHAHDVVREAMSQGGSFSLEYRVTEASGAFRWLAEHGRLIAGPDGRPAWIEGVIIDRPAQKQAEQTRGAAAQPIHPSGRDVVTCLPNRTLIRDRLEQMLLQPQRGRHLVTAFLMSLNNFGAIDHNLGKKTGDELIQAAAARLVAVLRPRDTVGRFGMDEFAILAEGLSLSGGPDLLAQRLMDALKEPFRVEGLNDVPLSISASIGIATSEPGSQNDLLRDAAIALRHAKTLGTNSHARFRPEMRTATMERLEIEDDLREAPGENQFFLLYQPIFELDTVGVYGVEALLRWRHPVRGFVDPECFLPVLEDTGMIVPVGAWALKQACRRASAWHRLGHRLTMAINISPRQLEAEDFVDQVQATLSATALAPGSLVIDISEKSLMTDSGTMSRKLHELKALGVLVTVNHFGSGGASLADLGQFPIDTLKIDRAFVAAMADSPAAASSVYTLVQLGRALGIETHAEGIEQDWQLAGLRDLQCTFGQGSLFSQPISPEALEAILSLEPLFS
jgi:diguanylate cyclase (GGDEF)-like protein/PAS domain S-box-containing protein